MYTTINLGWGRQSMCLAVMSVLGDLPKVDIIIHADTGHESSKTYEYAQKWTPWLESHGGNVVTVFNPMGNVWDVIKRGQMGLPAFTLYDGLKELKERDEAGNIIGTYNAHVYEKGQLNRSCTQRWKIAPIRKYIQAHRNKQPVEQWLGISMDESLRMKPSDVKYITHRWPLIEMKMTRTDCEIYLEQHAIEIPPKSACTFCPYHSQKEWQRIKSIPKDWDEAIAVDKKIRNLRLPHSVYLHPARKPLDTVNLKTDQERGQLSLWDDECTGLCGI